MKKSILLLVMLFTMIYSVSAAVTISSWENSPANGSYVYDNFTINVTTSLNANCSYFINYVTNGTQETSNTFSVSNTTSHDVIIDYYAMDHAYEYNITVSCMNATNSLDNTSSSRIIKADLDDCSESPMNDWTLGHDLVCDEQGNSSITFNNPSITFNCNGYVINRTADGPNIEVYAGSITITNCELTKATTALQSPLINIDGYDNFLLINSVLHSANASGIYSMGDEYANYIIYNNTFTGLGVGGYAAISLSNNMTNVNISDNTFTNNYMGIFFGETYNSASYLNNSYIYDNDFDVATDPAIQSSLPTITNTLIYHNNFLSDLNISTDIELSNGTSGNYWGHTSCPVFTAGTDTNAVNVTDSYPYNASDGWLTTAPATCTYLTLDYFEEDSGDDYIFVGRGDSIYMPYNFTLFLNTSINSSQVLVNVTHGGACIGLPNPAPMSYNLTDKEFYLDCVLNKSVIGEGNNTFTANAYLANDLSTTDQLNFTVSTDYTRPNIHFGWRTTDSFERLPEPHDILGNNDYFFSIIDNVIYLEVNATDDIAIDYVTAEFNLTNFATTTCNDYMNLTFNVTSGFWELNCSLGTFTADDLINETPELSMQSSDIMLIATDIYGNENNMYNVSNMSCTTSADCACFEELYLNPMDGSCTGAFVPLLIQDIGVPNMMDTCMRFGTGTTNITQVIDFTSVDFFINVEINMSCLENDSSYPATFEKVVSFNFTGLDFEDESVGNKLLNLESAIDVEITPPNSYGDSRIYVNSSFFAELNTTSIITFYNLPFTSAPSIVGDVGSAGVNTTSSWVSAFDPDFNATVGNLTFIVNGFSGYNITDSDEPLIAVSYPSNGSTYTAVDWFNFTVNGTGTAIAYATLVINGSTYVYNITGANTANCTASGELLTCQINVSLTDGIHSGVIVAYDFGGSYPGNTNTTTTMFTIDNTPPVTSDNAPSGWQTADFNITLNASDTLSGVNHTSYSVNGSALANGTTISITTEGNYTINYYSVDNAGNIESNNTITVLLDKINASTTDDAPSGWQNSAFNITLTPTDTLSGVASTTYYVDGSASSGTSIAITTDGNHTIVYYSTDNAGNVETNHTIYAALDTTAPVISGVSYLNKTSTGITIVATTDETATCFVDYGTTSSYGTASGNSNGTTHEINITILAQGTFYYYRINCSDVLNNSGVSSGGTFITFSGGTAEYIANTTSTINLNNSIGGSKSTFAVLILNTTSNINGTISALNYSINPYADLSGYLDVDAFINLTSEELNSSSLNGVEIRAYYDEDNLGNLAEADLLLYYYNETATEWQLLADQGVDTVNNYVRANTTHFSVYGIFGEEPEEESSGSSGGGSSIDSGTYLSYNTQRVTLSKYGSYYFRVRGNTQTHSIKIKEMKSDGVSFLIASDPQTVFVKEGETELVDVTGDGKADLKLELESFSLTSAYIRITQAGGEEVETPVDTVETDEVVTDDTGAIDTDVVDETPVNNNEVTEPVAEDTRDEEVVETSGTWWAWILAALILIIIIYMVMKKKK